MKWLNVLGMTLQFFSFWFAAPEILGEDKLKHYEEKIKKYISNLPTLIFGVPSLILLFVFLSSNKAIESGGTGVFLLILAVIFRKKIRIKFEEKIMQPLLDKLIESEDKRQDYLRIASILFTAGFILSIVATILS
ncbi:MAG: hypothetical protein MUE81_17350 [Thermoflexibacter sp.]|jgi:hypothetical protein|nr:hypothetical protein [Thermoflexibacter sp.]